MSWQSKNYCKIFSVQYAFCLFMALSFLYLCTQPSGPPHLIFEISNRKLVQRDKTINILIKDQGSWVAAVHKWSLKNTYKCPVHNCHYTRDEKYLPSMSDFDVLLFLAHHNIMYNVKKALPYRTPNQTYAILLSESPHTLRDVKPYKLNNLFNVTIGYQLDSDIAYEYGGFLDKVTQEKVSPALNPHWRSYEENYNKSFLIQSNYTEIIASKTKMAVWFVSNCHPTSHRMELAKAMQKYISIDIYGKCGKLICKDRSKCQEMMERDYKFYLSFENSLCEDYITEKVFSNMKKNIIPVIYNGANASRFLPPHSYINVEDYPTVKELTDHMQFLADNPQEYMSYFWWREHYAIWKPSKYCRICQSLHEFGSKQRPAYPDLMETYFKGKACRYDKSTFN